jgi:hypothetical protein
MKVRTRRTASTEKSAYIREEDGEQRRGREREREGGRLYLRNIEGKDQRPI